jgi:hypothetical protein
VTFLDGLALPGASAEIGVVLERLEPLPAQGNFPGTRIVFVEIGAPGDPAPAAAGAATVGDAGRALLALPAGGPGRRRFAARVEEPPGARQVLDAATGILEVVPAERPLLFVCFPPAGSPRPLGNAGAPDPLRPEEALRRLAAPRAVVYLVTDPQAAGAARAVFGEAAFPEGPVLVAAGSRAPGTPALDVEGVIKRLDLARRPAPHWAIARSKTEAADFALASIPVVVVGAEAAGRDGRIHFVEDWAAALRVIQAGGP